ncbi:MAG: hypothetical protein EA394_06220, partial [Bacteroidia bacterium]
MINEEEIYDDMNTGSDEDDGSVNESGKPEEQQPYSMLPFDRGGSEGKPVARLSGMYQDWFLDYASYVIL